MDIDETDQRDEDTPDDAVWFMVCKTEIDGNIQDVDFFFENLDDAYDWQKYFAREIEPIIVNEDAL